MIQLRPACTRARRNKRALSRSTVAVPMDNHRSRILVVDDDRPVRQYLCDLLANAGYAVEAAATGEAALEHIAGARADLVTLDLVMPGLDGWAVLERMEAMADA